MSLAILNRPAARLVSAPWAKTRASCEASASNLFSADVNGSPVSSLTFLGERLGEARMRVEAGADGGAALRQGVEAGQGRLDARDAERDLRRVAGELLAEGNRRRVLQVRAADLDDVGEGFGLVVEGAVQVAKRRQEAVVDLARRGDVHGGRKRVVRGLAGIDVVVRVHGRLAAALAAEPLVGEAGDDLVGVHVGLRAGAGLPDDERELVVVFALHDLGGGRRDRVGDARLELPEILVHEGRRLLDEAERAHQRHRHALAADLEIAERALRLRAPITVRRHLDRSERVGLDPGGFLRRFIASGLRGGHRGLF